MANNISCCAKKTNNQNRKKKISSKKEMERPFLSGQPTKRNDKIHTLPKRWYSTVESFPFKFQNSTNSYDFWKRKRNIFKLRRWWRKGSAIIGNRCFVCRAEINDILRKKKRIVPPSRRYWTWANRTAQSIAIKKRLHVIETTNGMWLSRDKCRRPSKKRTAVLSSVGVGVASNLNSQIESNTHTKGMRNEPQIFKAPLSLCVSVEDDERRRY